MSFPSVPPQSWGFSSRKLQDVATRVACSTMSPNFHPCVLGFGRHAIFPNLPKPSIIFLISFPIPFSSTSSSPEASQLCAVHQMLFLILPRRPPLCSLTFCQPLFIVLLFLHPWVLTKSQDLIIIIIIIIVIIIDNNNNKTMHVKKSLARFIRGTLLRPRLAWVPLIRSTPYKTRGGGIVYC